MNKVGHLGHKAEAELLKRIADDSPDMLYRMSLPEGKYEYVSPAAMDIFGEPPEKWYSTSKMITEFIYPESRLYFEQEWANLLAGDMPPTYEYQIITRAGETKWVGQRNVLVNDEIGKAIAIEGIVTDITERKRMEADLKVLASTDGLTSVYNRVYFNTKLDDEVQRAIRFRTPLSLLMLDIDHFKKINDTYGHLAGDACLVALGRLMQGSSRSVDTCARYGGEEFVIILPQTLPENATSFAERLRQKVETLEVKYEDQTIQFTVSIGINALSLTEEKTAEELLKTVDLLLYGAKESGRNCVVS